MPAQKLILDYVYDHESAQRNTVYLTQPVGAQPPIDYTWGQVLDQARRMAAHLRSRNLGPGAKIAIIAGNPREAGLFAFRLKLPAGYRIPPHEHPVTGHVTVLAGTFHIAVGERFDAASGDAVPSGGYSLMPANTRHYAWTDGETIIQIHGLGPWGIKYVNATDDPRTTAGAR